MKKLLGLLCLVTLVSGCATYHPLGQFYTEGKQSLQDNGGSVTREGRACMTSILGLVSTGDASTAAAKAAGNITRVSTIDYEVENVLGVYGRYCTVVRGE